MGNCSGSVSRGVQDSRKHLCILYNGSDRLQKKNAKSFRDALRGGDGGQNMIINFTDVSREHIDGLEWLSQIRHVLVVCVDQNGNGAIRRVLDRDGIRDGGPSPGTMHAKVLSVSFGTEPPQMVMGDLLQRFQVDKRDFCFNFQRLDEIDANDFDNSSVMRELRTTIISAMNE